tara:strand:- start:379 stop:564 length:186 start_codon:yes stop_codon:yes gene_type:complete
MKKNKEKIATDNPLKDINKFKKDLFNIRFQKINGQLKNYSQIKNLKKSIARLKTQMKEKNA